MTILLRGHHLLCLLTYVGQGYSDAFVANYDAVIDRLGVEDIRIVAGPDDICAPLLRSNAPHCMTERVRHRDELAMRSVTQVLGYPVDVGTVMILDQAHLAKARAAFGAGSTRPACHDCQWHALCTDVAGCGYEATRLTVG